LHRVLTLLLWLWFAAAVHAAEEANLKAGVFTPARDAPDFTLSGSDGAKLQLRDYRGKVVLLAFGFTSCPDVCPTTLAVLARARSQLGRDGNEVKVVYVTVDPARIRGAVATGSVPRKRKFPPTVKLETPIACPRSPKDLPD